jgi:hypothetical protein
MVGELLSFPRPKLASIAASTSSSLNTRHNMHSAARLSPVRYEWAEITHER